MNSESIPRNKNTLARLRLDSPFAKYKEIVSSSNYTSGDELDDGEGHGDVMKITIVKKELYQFLRKLSGEKLGTRIRHDIGYQKRPPGLSLPNHIGPDGKTKQRTTFSKEEDTNSFEFQKNMPNFYSMGSLHRPLLLDIQTNQKNGGAKNQISIENESKNMTVSKASGEEL